MTADARSEEALLLDTMDEPAPDVVVMARRAGTRWLSVLQEVVRSLNAGVQVVSVVDWHSASVQVYFDDDRPRCFKLDPACVPAQRRLFA